MSYNPKYLGPGYWASWHIKSIYSDTKSKKGEVARNIALDIKNFPCLKCQKHAKEYVKRHPLMEAVEKKDKLSMFKWIVDFHNDVNLRLKKQVITYDQALKLWDGKEFCLENCEEEENPVKEEPEVEENPESEEGTEDVIRNGSMLIRHY